MGSRGPITAELRAALDVDREFMRADGTVVAQTFCVDRDDFHRLCDAIDAVHSGLERENAELRARVAELDEMADSMHETDAWKLGYDEGFANADDWMADNEDAMAEHGWYRALCADRKPMLLGDRMEWANGTFTIHELRFTEGGCTTWDSEHGYTVNADECHHHAPTVEDVLREFSCVLMGKREFDGDVAEAISEYAAKLRLAGDAE